MNIGVNERYQCMFEHFPVRIYIFSQCCDVYICTIYLPSHLYSHLQKLIMKTEAYNELIIANYKPPQLIIELQAFHYK